MKKITSIITSKYFLIFILVLFSFQAIIYAAGSRYGVPADEKYHFESIKYYAEEPVLTGPFTKNQAPETISEVRYIDRNTSYLYHYSLSVPLRIMNKLSIKTEKVQIFAMRLISIVFALMTLLVFKRILDELSDNELLKNLSVAALSLTGMFVWLAGAINYDNLANLLFMLFLYFSVLFFKKPDLKFLPVATIFGLATVITKYTFVPVVGLSILLMTFILIKKYGFIPRKYLDNIRKLYKPNKVIFVLVALFLLLFSFLFIERVGANFVRYGQVQPGCNKIFTYNQCYENFPIFKRNKDNRAEYRQEGGFNALNTNIFAHTGEWTYSMYKGLYYYFGHERVDSHFSRIGQVAMFISMIFLLLSLFLSRQRININGSFKFIIAAVLLYAALLYLFNLKTFVTSGERVAYQGRYLLPVLGFLYFFVFLVIYNTAKNIKRNKRLFIYSWITVGLLFWLIHFPPILFYEYAKSSADTPYSLNDFDL